MAEKGPALATGDTIGIVTPGSPLPPAVIDARVRYLRGLGYQVVLGRHVYEDNGYLAGPDEARAEDLMSMFTDTRLKLILAARGGVGVEGTFPHLDFGVIRGNPKLVSGYSDVTILLNVLNQYAGIVTLHSLMLIDFRPETPAYNFEQFFTEASSTEAPRPIRNPPGMPLTGRVPGTASGPMLGGNLTSLVGSLGTPYEIDTTGAILLLEETHEPINRVYRAAEQLKLAGKLEACAGIVMGQCTNCPEAYGKSYRDFIEDFIVPLGKPLITNLASGHGYYKAAIPIGVQFQMDAAAATLTQMEPAVRPRM